ncbi:MAG: hypothetical protein E7543_08630 [Ruminococcaceae bacterium]|nr:hypothetical protein [Oscillospiraceae bacterium]
MKKALLLHYDLFDTFSLLSDEELGRLIRAVFEYDMSGDMPDFEDRLLMACFMRIAECLDRNNIRYEQVCQKKAESARRRWEKIRQAGVEN